MKKNISSRPSARLKIHLINNNIIIHRNVRACTSRTHIIIIRRILKVVTTGAAATATGLTSVESGGPRQHHSVVRGVRQSEVGRRVGVREDGQPVD